MTTRIRLILAPLVWAALLPASDLHPQSAFVIDPAQTDVEFTLGSTLHTIHGTFHLTRGDLRFDPASGRASGELVVDAGSGDSGSSARDKRMNHSILESPQFPEIAFRPDHVEGAVAPRGKSQLELHGAFLMHGQSHELTVHLIVEANDGQYAVTGNFSVPYAKWGMKNPSTLFLRVNDKVDITVHTVAHSRP
jgi:polyisoprenoid-binding protein YceI